MSPSSVRFRRLLIATVLGITFSLSTRCGPDGSTGPTPRSLAVLAFEEDPFDSGQPWLASGLTFDLRCRLRTLRGLQLAAGDPMPPQRLPGEPLSQLARRLGAEILILGSVQPVAGQVRWTVEVIDGLDGQPLARIELEESSERVFELQRTAAERIVKSLSIASTPAEIEALRLQPTRSLKAWIYFVQGQSHWGEDASPKGPTFAADLFRRALLLDPEFLQARLGLGTALWLEYVRFGGRDRLLEAELEARRVLTRQPDSAAAVVLLTLVLQTAERLPADSPFDIPELARLDKPDEALREIAAWLHRVGQLEASEAAWRAAVNRGGGLWLNPYRVGQFLSQGGRYVEAADAFAEAAATSPANLSWAQEALIGVELATGNLAGAVGAFEQLAPETDDVELLRAMADAYLQLGNLASAASLYERALTATPMDATIHRQLGDLLQRMQSSEEASALYSRGLELLEHQLESSPTDRSIQQSLAVMAAKSGRCDRALPLMVGLHRQLPPSATTSYDLALVHVLCDDRERAEEILMEALKLGLDPERIRTEPDFRSLIAAGDLFEILHHSNGDSPDR